MSEGTSREKDAVPRGRLTWTDLALKCVMAVQDAGDLACVLRDDQRRRWRRGERARSEDYLADFPALRGDERGAADLVFQEFCLREEFGPPPTLDEFRGRFAQLIARLERRLAVHQLFQDEKGTVTDAATRSVSKASGNWDDAFPTVPRYDILRELGRGGMGVVYLAAQEGLDRFVALKMILPGSDAKADDLLRFRVEAAAISRLQHVNLVQIYDVGDYQGLPYFSLEFVDGGSLEDKLKGQPMPPRDAARMTHVLARAIHVAHERGIVHRDLKPANVLLTADGIPKITDFGVAKRVDRGGKPKAEAVFGTPCYMAPEQVRGKTEEVGPHTDVYALGAMLYEFLTGYPPLLGDTVRDTLLMVLTQDPESPSQLQSGVPRALEVICLKCLEKDVARRYPSAAALADDLEAFLGGEKNESHASGLSGWLSRWVKGGG